MTFGILAIFLHSTAPTQVYTLSLHDALPILDVALQLPYIVSGGFTAFAVILVGLTLINVATKRQDAAERSEEHTSELQSHSDLVCRLLLEKKKQASPESERYEGHPVHRIAQR